MLQAATLGLRAVRTGALGVACLVVVDRASAQEPECTPSFPPRAHPRQEDISSASSNSEPAVDLDAWLAAQQDNRPQAAAPQTDALALGTQHLFGNALLRDLERERQQRRQADRQAQELQQQQPEIPVEDDDSVQDLCSLPDDDTYVERPVELDSDDDNVPVGLEPAPLTQGGKHDVTAPFFGTVNAFAAVVAADRLGVLEPGLDASEEQLEENCRRVEAEMVADTESVLPAYFENLAGNDVVGAARDLREETLKKVKEKQTHWMTLGKLGKAPEHLMQAYRRVVDAVRASVVDGSHPFLAQNRKRERGPAEGGTPGTPWDQYRNCKNRIKAKIEAGDSLSPLHKALAEQFKKDDPDYIYGTGPSGAAPSGPVQMVVDTKQLVESDARIRVMEKVCKKKGTLVVTNRRYEQTKGATTAKQFISAGCKIRDLSYDIKKGFVKVLEEIPERRKLVYKDRLTEEQKNAMAARYLEIIEEHQS